MKRFKMMVAGIGAMILLSGCGAPNSQTSKDETKTLTVKESLRKNPQVEEKKLSDKAKEMYTKKADKVWISKILEYSTQSFNAANPRGVISYKNGNNILEYLYLGSQVYVTDDVDAIKGNYLLIKRFGNEDFYYVISEKAKEEIIKNTK